MTKRSRVAYAWVIALTLTGLTPSYANDAESTFERSQALETESVGLLLEHFQFEESLLAPDNDRLTVFVSVPHGGRMVMQKVVLNFNGKPVVTHSYSVDELTRFLGESSQLLYLTRIPQGEHTIRLDVTVMQGHVRQMKTHTLRKGKAAKFIELRVEGNPVREVVVAEW